MATAVHIGQPQTLVMELNRPSFHVAAPVIWNSFPEHLCSPSIAKGQFTFNQTELNWSQPAGRVYLSAAE